MAKVDLIETALTEVKSQGVKIKRRILFNWNSPDGTLSDIPIECDSLGAVLIAHNKASPGFPKGWLKTVCDILETDTYWLWRFWMGFDNGHPLTIIVKNTTTGKEERKEDTVSKLGVKMARKFCE